MGTTSTIKVAGRTFELFAVSGEVVDDKKWAATSETRRDGYVSSTTTTHDQILVQCDDGLERSLHVAEVHLAARRGHRVTLVLGFKKPKKSGPYVAVYNHNTHVRDLLKWPIKTLAAPHIGLKWAAIIVGLLALMKWVIAGSSGGAAPAAFAMSILVFLIFGLPCLCLVRYFLRCKRIEAEVDVVLERHMNK
jgi:hypothetical protein